MTTDRARLTLGQRRRLVAVARGAAPASLYVRGGTVLNGYTGEIAPASIAVVGERVAYVGARDGRVGSLGSKSDPAAMTRAVNRLLALHGGSCWWSRGRSCTRSRCLLAAS